MNASSSKLEIQLGGMNPGIDHDQLVVNGTVDVTGNLDVIAQRWVHAHRWRQVYHPFQRWIEAINGNFNGLSEGAMFSAGSHVFSISYQGGTGTNVLTRVLASEWMEVGADIKWSTAANWLAMPFLCRVQSYLPQQFSPKDQC